MEDTISNPSMEPLLFSVDPISLLLSQNNNLCGLERGPRYREYATLRESKLRLNREYEKILKEEEERFFRGGEKKKQTRFSFTRENEIRVSKNPNPRRLSSLAQAVPDFLIRKENRQPSNMLLRRGDVTPPPSKGITDIRGSASVSAGEKNVRKSYATVEDLKKISMAAALAITCGGRKSLGGGGRRKSVCGGGGGTILGYRQS
ncbi:unnamed protein product [Eruca vesicaria subsp. sativa]|uniref:Uncharacterized protein n=1 Tax=Eruca vesicaria subsp. sativa TaxID=29727 RepID=A0ABC8LHZ8_ERUVS|nr:unnamed protein product [Eruca vesicaria subsp. sativa]